MAPETHTRQGGLRKAQKSKQSNDFEIEPERISCRPDRSGANGSLIRVRMQKLEVIKVG